MRSLLFFILVVYLAPMTVAVEAEEAMGDIAEAIEGLSAQLFLNEAHNAIADGDYLDARDKFAWLAERGNAEARLALGIMYEEGKGIPRDYEKAVELYLQAARQGFAPAQLRLARMYYFGRHVRQDNFLAYVWTSIAALQGDDIARRNRDKIAGLMNDQQVSSAQSLADEWAAKYNSR